jgi:hypothetical protein
MQEEQTVDTSDLPDEGQVAEADGEQIGTEEIQESAPQITAEEIIKRAKEEALQSFQSWTGRRDSELVRTITNMIDDRFRSITTQPTPVVASDPSALLENPEAWAEAIIPKILDRETQKRSKAEQDYTANIIRHAGEIMNADPLYEDQELGKAVIDEIKDLFPSLDRRLPADVGAKLLVDNAVLSIVRRNRSAKVNPLAGNSPGRAPTTISAPVSRKSAPVKMPKLSEEAARLVKHYGYDPETVAKLFPEEG